MTEQDDLEGQWNVSKDIPDDEEEIGRGDVDIIDGGPHRWILHKSSHGGARASRCLSSAGKESASGVCISGMGGRPTFTCLTPLEGVIVGFLGGWSAGGGRSGTPSGLASVAIVVRTGSVTIALLALGTLVVALLPAVGAFFRPVSGLSTLVAVPGLLVRITTKAGLGLDEVENLSSS